MDPKFIEEMLSSADQAKLKQAHNLIMEVRAGLNLSSEECDGCGGTHYEDWDQYQINERLKACTSRIRKMLDF